MQEHGVQEAGDGVLLLVAKIYGLLDGDTGCVVISLFELKLTFDTSGEIGTQYEVSIAY